MRSLAYAGLVLLAACQTADPPAAPPTVRIMTYNIEDTRTLDVQNVAQPRLKAAAEMMQTLRPDILLLNEIAYDMPGVPGYDEAAGAGQNGQRLADNFFAIAQRPDLAPLRYTAFMPPSNTGIASGLDFDNSGTAVTDFPPPRPSNPDGSPARQTPEGRAYGNDTYGFGTFPGQYAMTVLVREGLEILTDEVRTFQRLPWSALPDGLIPISPDTNEPWYNAEEWAAFRLSSKTHADVPVRLPDGTVIHLFISHPTPPAFDGPEQRNKMRNHDEIRFWRDYLDGASYIADDAGNIGGFGKEAPFVIMGDLNADPDEGSAFNNPIANLLLNHSRINGTYVPRATAAGQTAFPDLDPDDTARWGLRADYVLPSTNLTVQDGGVWRPTEPEAVQVSDHFPVWLEVVVAQ